MTLETVTVSRVQGIGVYVRGGSLQGTDLVIEGVGTGNLRGPGRFGLWAGGASSLRISNCAVTDIRGTAILAVAVPEVVIEHCRVSKVTATVAGGGDGVVVAALPNGTRSAVILTDISVVGAARMGIAVSGVDANLEGNRAGEANGMTKDGTAIFADAEAQVSGTDAWASFSREETPILLAYSELGQKPGNQGVP